MGAESGTISAGLAGSEVGEKLLREPFAFDFFQAVRLLERLLPGRTAVGQFAHPETEVALLNSRAGVPSWGPELLARTYYALGSGVSAIDTLPEPFRVVLVARLVEEMSIEQTAELLAIRPETVKTRLHRARKLLRDHMEREVGPLFTDVFPFAGKRCERMADAVIVRLRTLRCRPCT